MRTWIHRLGNLKVAVVLLGVILVALAAGTVVESVRGTPEANRLVYGALWFEALLVLFTINVGCSLADLWPWGWRRAGFATTHLSLLLILAGSLITWVGRDEGMLEIWEGEAAAAFQQQDGGTVTLPFAVRLESFEIDYYQGTRRPAMFRSRVVVEDPARGAFPAIIEMNRELKYGDWRFYQSSYRETPQRDMTVLQVSRDPGEWVVFAGYFLLMGGMVTVLTTRIVQRRQAAPLAGIGAGLPLAGPVPPKSRRGQAVAVGLLAAIASASLAGAGQIPDDATVAQLRSLAVQHDGRVMPLDTLAREAVWRVTGRSAWKGQEPAATMLGWTLHGDEWATERIVRLGGSQIAERCAVPLDGGRASFLELVKNACVLGLFQQARAEAESDRPVRGILDKARGLEDRLLFFQSFLQGTVYRVAAPPGDPRGEWLAPRRIATASDLAAFAAAGGSPPIAAALLRNELTYNAVRPSRVAWAVLWAATLFGVLASRFERRWLDGLAVVGLTAGFAVMTWGIAVRWQIAGRIPASNMYESLLILGWGVALFALVALVFLRNRLVVLNAAAMAALTMTLTDLLPVDRFVHPVPPVLAGTAWLGIHVPIIMLSYSVLALGVLAAHLQIGFEIFAASRRDWIQRAYDLLYWYVHIGAILLIAGILTGSMWASSSWGRYWGWDPKEVWSLVAFLAYIAILHGRVERWIGPFGVAACSIVAFWTILMTYLGVNFILAAGLHSYGFGGSSVAGWMTVVALAEAGFLLLGWVTHRRRLAAAPDRPVTVG